MNDVAPLVTGILLIGAATIFTFGYAVAMNRRDNSDLKGTKAKIPGLRKAYWTSLWDLIKRSLIIGGVLALLLLWAVNSVQRESRLRPSPTESAR
jgi:hypothetical protein